MICYAYLNTKRLPLRKKEVLYKTVVVNISQIKNYMSHMAIDLLTTSIPCLSHLSDVKHILLRKLPMLLFKLFYKFLNFINICFLFRRILKNLLIPCFFDVNFYFSCPVFVPVVRIYTE